VTFLELCKTVRQELGISGNGPASVSSTIYQEKALIDWVKAADLLVQRLHPDWDFLWSSWTQETTAGTQDYDAPADLGMWDRESFALERGTSNGQRLSEKDFRADRNYVTERENATPVNFIVLPSQNVRLYPPPDDAYTLSADYWKAPVAMSENTDESVIPEQYRRIIVARAKMFYAEEAETFNLYQTYGAEFNDLLNDLEAHFWPGQKFRATAMPPKMRVIAQ
jgi:hypothetical protein